MIHDIGYNHHLTFFDTLLPVIIKDYETFPETDSLYQPLHDAVTLLVQWNRDASDTSVAAAIAIEYGYRFLQTFPPPANAYGAGHAVEQMQQAIQATTPRQRLLLLSQTLQDLTQRFGKWRIPWGEDNRYQRPADGVFDDAKPSLPVSFAASSFGSLPAFVTRRFPNSNKRYGIYGNSFVACVEFGKTLTAKSVITGGQSFDPQSPHFSTRRSGTSKAILKMSCFTKRRS